MGQLYKILIILFALCSACYADPTASRIRTSVVNFNYGLSSSDTDVQKALNTIDDKFSLFIPYSGASQDINLGSVSLTTSRILIVSGTVDSLLMMNEGATNDNIQRGSAPESYYGKSNEAFLAIPAAWFYVKIGDVAYTVPAYAINSEAIPEEPK